MIAFTGSGVKLIIDDKPLAASGGEGSVHRITSPLSFQNHCVKLYHLHKLGGLKLKKINFMTGNRPASYLTKNFILCWPVEKILDANKSFIGFLMPLAFLGSEKLYEICTPKLSKKISSIWDKFDRNTLSGVERRFKICVNIAIAIHSIHATQKYVIVDYKPQNILINPEGKVSITDVDSFQISEKGSLLYASEVVTPEYSPPENTAFKSAASISETWDRFSLAVSFYEILLGIHPYAATSGGYYESATTIAEKIQKGLFVHGSKRKFLTKIPNLHDRFYDLPVKVRHLFIRALEDGCINPVARPSAEEWGKTLYHELELKSIKPLITKAAVKTVLDYPKPTVPPKYPPVPPPKQDSTNKWLFGIGSFLLLCMFFVCSRSSVNQQSNTAQTVIPQTQTITQNSNSNQEDLVTYDAAWTDTKPSFPGGENAFGQYVKDNQRYHGEVNGQSGYVTVSFVVDKYGYISDAMVSSGFDNSDWSGKKCNSEALRLVNNMPKWNPGYIGNSPKKILTQVQIWFEPPKPITMSCPGCSGSGYLSKQSTCDLCSGLGYRECSSCLGAGYLRCGVCYGSGVVKKHPNRKRSKLEYCSYCGGDGNVSCRSCSTGKVSCTNCSGHGVTTRSTQCQRCKGSGKIQIF